MQGVYRFSETATITYESTVVSPRLAKTSSGGFAIVVTRGTGQSQNLMIASSSDGIGWTPFSQLDSDLQGNINSNPSFAYLGKRDFVVFQSANLALATSNAGEIIWPSLFVDA